MPFEFSEPTERTYDMQATNGVKEEARQLVERLPDTATWDDLMEEIYVRQVVERGLRDLLSRSHPPDARRHNRVDRGQAHAC